MTSSSLPTFSSCVKSQRITLFTQGLVVNNENSLSVLHNQTFQCPVENFKDLKDSPPMAEATKTMDVFFNRNHWLRQM